MIYYIFPTYSQAKKVIWDSITNTGDRILDYIPDELVASKNSQEMKIRFVNGSLLQLVGSDNYDCFDDQTEILSENGWKLFKDLDVTEKVATLVDENLVYEVPLKHVQYDFDGEMYAVSNSGTDFMVTPNHRFFVKSPKGSYKFKEISDQTIRGDMIPSQCKWVGQDIETYLGYRTEDFMALLGIFLSEGRTFSNHKSNRVTISQTKQHIRADIKALLNGMGINATATNDGFNIESKALYEYFSQFGLQHGRFIPKDIKNLDKKYLHILFEWLVLGDGHRCNTYTSYYSTSKKLIDDVQELIIKLGLSGNIHIKPQNQSSIKGRLIESKRTLYEVKVRRSKFKRFTGASGKSYIHKIPYQGKVFCVSVPSGVIKVRRNGKEMWSGNSLMGTNPQGVVFSEYALQDPRAYQFIRPILLANDGWALFLSTPRGKNHLWELWQIAQHSKDWFGYKLTVEDTGHIPLHDIEKEKHEGLMSEDLIQQEYYCSFEMGVEGSYYAKYLDRMRVKSQIGQVPWEMGFKVHTAWDIGVRDSTTIIFFQTIGQTVRIIDCYEKSKEGLEHYVKVINSKPYTYGKHIAPHDIKVREFGSGMTRIEKAKQLGLVFTVAPDVSIVDGIESVRSALSKIYIDESSCSSLIKALENYRQEYDVKRRIYKPHALHDWSSHFCFTGDTEVLTRHGMRQIMLIEENDEILTLEGWQKCTKAQITQRNAKLVEVQFSDGTIVRCTPDHLFLTSNGWKSARNLKRNSRIQSSLMNLRDTLMDLCTVYGLMRSTLLKAESDCIERYGKKLLGQFLKIVTFITKTIMPLTTTCGTSNVSLRTHIEEFLGHLARDFQILLESERRSGTAQMLESYGIKDMLSDQKIGLDGNDEQQSAFSVNKSLRHLLEEMGTSKNIVTQTVRPLIIVGVRNLKETADVWDIGVPSTAHFSLSNGAIVHNCDAMRYLAISLPKTRDGLSPEELDKRYQEAVMGDNAYMPSVFRTDLPPY